MAPPFLFPSDLRDLESDDDGHPARRCVHTLVDVASLRSSDLDELVKGVVFDLSDKELFCVEEQDVFDRVYSLVKGYSHIGSHSRSSLVETLRSNLSVLLPSIETLSRTPLSSPLQGSSSPASGLEDEEGFSPVDRVGSYRNALKIYTFFLLTIVFAEESCNQEVAVATATKGMAQSRKKVATKGWNWEPQRAKILNLIANSLEVNLSLLFGSSDPDENYLSFITRCVFSLFENQILLKDVVAREALCRIVGTISVKYHRAAQASVSILHLVYKFDFSVPHLAEAIASAEKKYGDGTLAVSLIREIGLTDPKDFVRDAAGAENVAKFLVELADRSPKLMATNIGILIPHFGGESYKIRNSLVSVLGKLVAKSFKDADGDFSSKSLRLKGKQAMLEILLERCRDVSAYTRSRVLQVWAELCGEHALSIAHWNEVASVASGRLEDKSTMVRKSALNLLIMMLQHNPFGPQLRIAAFEATLKKYQKELHEMAPTEPSKQDIDYAFGGLQREQSNSISDSCLSPVEDVAEKGKPISEVGNLEQTRVLVASLEAGLRFSRCITSTLPTLVQLLASSSSSDVENTILLLMRCRQFQIDGSEACLCKMFPLVFSQDKSISEAVENAFMMIYIRKNPAETAANLLTLAVESNIGDLAALEFLIGSLMSKGEISSGMISALWDIFSFNVNGVTALESRGALSILCMAAKSSPGILGSHLQDIIDIGFGRWAKEEPLLARTACIALERLSADDKEKLGSSGGSKLFSILQNLITGFWLPDNIWYPFADKAINVLYSTHPTPEIFAADIVKRSLSSVFSCGSSEGAGDFSSGSTGFIPIVSISKLSRYLFVTSQVALTQLVYIESCIKKIQKQKSKKDKTRFESLDVDGVCATPAKSVDKKDGINGDLGLAASEDAIIDGLSERAEREILSSSSSEKSLIGNSAAFVSKLCRNYALLQKFPELQASAMLALCRLMIIDADFCEANLQLLFTVVEGAPSETVRSNCTVALGDLAVRFPNLLEPWTENMYARLRDPSASVRKNAVLVLSHLILNDMMKVKGYINEMAIRVEDENERISSLAKLFFQELSKKGSNPIYNLLPDILGRLCNQNLNNEAFGNIMQFLISSIKKDKQMDALVEKLCNRFSGVSDTRQWEYIAYCLSQLTFTEKGMKKFMEHIKTYEHVLCEDSVMDNFKKIISKGKKSAKPELKSCIEEFEEKLNKIHMERKEQEITARNAQEHQHKFNKGLVEVEEDNGDGTSEVINSLEDDGVHRNCNSTLESNYTMPEEACRSNVTIESEVGSAEIQS